MKELIDLLNGCVEFIYLYKNNRESCCSFISELSRLLIPYNEKIALQSCHQPNIVSSEGYASLVEKSIRSTFNYQHAERIIKDLGEVISILNQISNSSLIFNYDDLTYSLYCFHEIKNAAVLANQVKAPSLFMPPFPLSEANYVFNTAPSNSSLVLPNSLSSSSFSSFGLFQSRQPELTASPSVGLSPLHAKTKRVLPENKKKGKINDEETVLKAYKKLIEECWRIKDDEAANELNISNVEFKKLNRNNKDSINKLIEEQKKAKPNCFTLGKERTFKKLLLMIGSSYEGPTARGNRLADKLLKETGINMPASTIMDWLRNREDEVKKHIKEHRHSQSSGLLSSSSSTDELFKTPLLERAKDDLNTLTSLLFPGI